MPHEVRYTIAMPRPHTHLFHVTVEADGLAGEHADFVMPVWTPGAYAVRDFARHVMDVQASGRWTKVDKSRWRVHTGGASRVRISYKVFAFELEVDRSHLDASHGYFNGASVFMHLDGGKERPCLLEVKAPRGWRVVTGLRRVGPNRFLAQDYDELIDSPTDVGTAPVRTFKVRGKTHRVLVHGVQNWDLDRMVRHVRKIVEEEASFFGGLPYRDYTFLYFATTGPALGGLEHRNSTAITLSPWIGRPFKSYERLLEVTSHEFFHLWNVKRIRPEVLGPFDYEKENYTGLLWVMEGLTSFYDDLFCERAGLYPAGRYLKKMAEQVQAFRDKPSRLRHSLTASSHDTWLWGYKGDPNSVNRFMSYYEKGALVGMCLDLEIRHRTRNRRSLDDVMRHLWREFGSQGRTLREDEARPVVEQVAGGSYAEFFRDYVDGTREIPFERFLSYAGLELAQEPPKGEDAADEPEDLAWLGVQTRSGSERPQITAAVEDGPAWRDGLSPGDELVAVDGARVTNDNFTTLLKDRRPGDTATFSIFREAALLEVRVRLGAKPNGTPTIRPLKRANALQKSIHKGWLKKPWKPPAAT